MMKCRDIIQKNQFKYWSSEKSAAHPVPVVSKGEEQHNKKKKKKKKKKKMRMMKKKKKKRHEHT